MVAALIFYVWTVAAMRDCEIAWRWRVRVVDHVLIVDWVEV
jgi:hypothetical protein